MTRRSHKKTHRRRGMRGGAWWNPFSWGRPAPTGNPVTDATASLGKPVVSETVGTPSEQAKLLGTPAPGAPGAPDALTGVPTGGRRRTRKHRKSRRRHR